MTPCQFTFDETPVFNGYSHGSRWNGFDNVAVDASELARIVAYFRRVGDNETADDIAATTPMDNGLVSLGWAFTTTIATDVDIDTTRDREGNLLWRVAVSKNGEIYHEETFYSEQEALAFAGKE
jgi:hypothetical protein